eukprot:Nitzschia sp. Nitz4//scaffold701_size1989//681//1321//NITZ4_009305-RA/size1989-processed-gene-0.3-mRNA-1//-1//CDS//3329557069//5514//frame0
MQQRRPVFSSCGPSDVKIQVWSQFDLETSASWFLPQHFALGPLHDAYPDATWIFNTRSNARDWAESVYHWHSMTRRIFNSFGVPLQGLRKVKKPPVSAKFTAEDIENDIQVQLDVRVYNQSEHLRKMFLLEQIYMNHTATVRNWASQFPSHKFIEVDVDDPISVAVLDELFGFDSVGMGAAVGLVTYL